MKHTLLIVDDDKLILNTLRERFSQLSGEIFVAEGGDSAREILGRVRPDAVLLDLLLTKGDGAASIMDYMNSREELRHVPVIIFTNLDSPDLRQMAREKGAKEYLIKGQFSLDQLFEKVMEYLEPTAEK